jgi:hypothetical protein
MLNVSRQPIPMKDRFVYAVLRRFAVIRHCPGDKFGLGPGHQLGRAFCNIQSFDSLVGSDNKIPWTLSLNSEYKLLF